MIPSRGALEGIAGGVRNLFTAKKELEIAALRSELAKAQERITQLEADLRRRDEMTFEFPFYFRAGNPNPLCPHCWETEKLQIHLKKPFHHVDGGAGYACSRCEALYRTDELLPGTAYPKETDRRESRVGIVENRSSLRDRLKYY